MADTVRVARRFCGPPDSGNGGYVAGLLARRLRSSNVAVTLHRPPPLDRDLDIGGDGTAAWLRDGDTLIASAERAEVAIDPPPPPALPDVERVEADYFGFRRHAFPGCFVCGPDRTPGEGLRIFPGSVAPAMVAAIWKPDGSLLDAQGALRPEFVWAALDCPGYWAVAAQAGIAVLGRFSVILHADRIEPAALLVTGWPIASEGRKHQAGTALYASDGRLLAAAHATWITLK